MISTEHLHVGQIGRILLICPR